MSIFQFAIRSMVGHASAPIGVRSMVRALVFLLAMGAVAVPDVAAQVRVRLAWNPNPDSHTVGYRVFVRNAAAALGSVDVGTATTVLLPLPAGAEYFVDVRGYTALGVVGPPSEEIEIDLVAPPGAPTGFGASVSGSQASLSWAPPASGGSPITYLLSVGTGPGASNLVNGYSVGNTLGLSSPLPAGTYYARIRAANLVGTGPSSSEISFTVGASNRPAAPTQLSTTWAGTVAQLSWTPPSTTADRMPAAYVVEAGTAPGVYNIGSINVGSRTSYAIDVPPGTYYVRVRGVGPGGISDATNEIVLQGQGAPGQARRLIASASGNVVNLRWSAPSSGPAVSSYVIEVGTAPGLSNLVSAAVGNVTAFASTVPPGTYYVRVRAANARGLGAPSNEVVVRR